MEATLISPLSRTTLNFSPLSIGRAPDNQLVIDSPEVAAHHAEIKPGPDGATHLVIDQSNTEGTFVNEERLPTHTPRPLNTGDVIRIGNLHFTYEITGIVNPDEPPTATSPASYEHTVAVTSSTISTNTTDAALNQSPASSPTPSNNGTLPPPPPDYSDQSYAQAAYSPSDYPSTPDLSGPQQRKGRIGLWLAIAIVVLLVAAGSSWGFFSYINRSTPTKTLQAFCTTFQKGDAQGLYNLLSKRAQAMTSIDKLKAVFGLMAEVGGVQNCTVSSVQENGSTATGNVTMNLQGKNPGEPYPEHLINEGGTWKMDVS